MRRVGERRGLILSLLERGGGGGSGGREGGEGERGGRGGGGGVDQGECQEKE